MIIDGVIEFLSGETRPILPRWSSGCARLRPRSASRRPRATAIGCARSRASRERQAADKRAVGTIDVIGLAATATGRPCSSSRCVTAARRPVRLPPRERRGAGSGDHPRVVLCRALRLRAGVPPQIVVPPDVDDTEALASFLGDLRGARVEVRSPQRGEKLRLAELAEENARLALAHDASAAEQRRQRRVEALEQLRESLNLESLPMRIECFDVSNIQGREIVASMAVFVNAEPRKAHYRTFAVRGLEGQDDFAAMAQVVADGSHGCATLPRPTAGTRASRPCRTSS